MSLRSCGLLATRGDQQGCTDLLFGFPAIRENNREFADFRPSGRALAPICAAIPACCPQIPGPTGTRNSCPANRELIRRNREFTAIGFIVRRTVRDPASAGFPYRNTIFISSAKRKARGGFVPRKSLSKS